MKEGTIKKVKSARRDVARLEVDEERRRNEASNTMGRMINMAKGGWNRIKNMLEGKRLVREEKGRRVLLKDKTEGREEGEEDMEEWEEKTMGGEVEIEIEVMGTVVSGDSGSVWKDGRRGTGFEFLEEIPKEDKEQDLEERKEAGRKRKRSIETGERKRNVGETAGWKNREEVSRNSDRWVREVQKSEVKEDGTVEMVKTKEKISLPENYRLGQDERGGFLNNSSKFKNNFGINKEGLFPGGRDEKKEEKNWLATFTKSGCIACRNEQGRVNHTGRDGTPVVLVIGDEAVPSVVGHTDEGERESRCAWVLKKEHLALEEVAGILERVNKQKREADKKCGKRMHEFFVPNGSKVLVGSYVHLRREGLEGYVVDFNSMVRAVREVTGDCGIEVLPVAPVVFEGLDETGKILIQAVREWIKWVGEKSGREEICALSETGGGRKRTRMSRR